MPILSANPTPLDLLPLAAHHLAGAVRLSQQAKWPHRLDDWTMSLALSEGLVAVAKGTDVVGTVLVTPYGAEVATINMVIVDESQRGQGLGRRLMQAAIQIAGARPLRLVATEDGLPLYEKLGFVVTGRVLQHQGVARSMPRPNHIELAKPIDLAAIVALDAEAFGADREALLGYIANVGRFAVLRRNNRTIGFAGLRAFGRGEVIGPVVAPDIEDAKSLISFLLADRPGVFVRVDTTAAAGLGPWLAEIGLAHVGGGLAMQQPLIVPRPHPPVATFALANQAFG